MKKYSLICLLLCFLASFLAGIASAEILWDCSPDATGAGIVTPCYTNQVGSQQLAEKITFSDKATISGMDIFSATMAGVAGQLVRIYIWSDNAGIPGMLLHEFDETITVIDNEGTVSQPTLSRKNADFTTPVDLTAGTYWIAMTSAVAGVSLCQATLAAVDDDQFAICHSGTFTIMRPVGAGDMAFRLHGTRPHNTWLIDTVDAGKSFSLSSPRAISEDSQGHPHIVYGGDHLYHAYFDGTSWHEEIIDNAPGRGGDAQICIDTADHIHIVYSDYVASIKGEIPLFWYATNRSGSWEYEGLSFLGDTFWINFKMAVEPSGVAHIAFTTGDDLVHASNASGTWAEVDVIDNDTNSCYDMTMDSAGHIHVLYFTWPNIRYATNASGAWENEIVVGVWNGGRGAAICVDASGNPRVAYTQTVGYDDNVNLAYAARNPVTEDWELDTIDPVGIANAMGELSVAMDSTEKAHVIYSRMDIDALYYAVGNPGAWQTEMIAAAGDGGRYGSIAASSSGEAHICYWDTDNGAVNYVGGSIGNWTSQTIATGSTNLGSALSVATDAAGQFHISYADTGSELLKYASGAYGSWTIETIDTGFIASTSLGLDGSGFAHILYQMADDSTWRYATNARGSWDMTTLTGLEEHTVSMDLAVDAAGRLHLCSMHYEGDYTNRTYFLHYKYADNAAGQWTTETVYTDSDLGYEPKLTVDRSGHIYLCFTDNNGYLLCATNASGTWAFETIDDNRVWPEVYSVVLDSSNHLHVAYTDYDAITWDQYLCYATNASGSWAHHLVTGPGEYSQFHLAVDTTGQLHMSFNQDISTIKYITGIPGAWDIQTIEDRIAYSWNGIATDVFDNVHIAYREYGNRILKYATISSQEESGPGGNDPGYDGNGNGIPDCQEENVASFHTADGNNYVTLASDDGTVIQSVEPLENPSPINTPDGVDFPFQFFRFTITNISVTGEATVTLYLPAGTSISAYWKYGATPIDPEPHWYEFDYDGTTGAEIFGNVVILHFVDGQRGDNDLTVNGMIVDPGAPGLGGIPGDLDNDADVDGADRNILMASLRKCNGDTGFNPIADLDDDGCVTLLDYRQWYIYYKASLAAE